MRTRVSDPLGVCVPIWENKSLSNFFQGVNYCVFFLYDTVYVVVFFITVLDYKGYHRRQDMQI